MKYRGQYPDASMPRIYLPIVGFYFIRAFRCISIMQYFFFHNVNYWCMSRNSQLWTVVTHFGGILLPTNAANLDFTLHMISGKCGAFYDDGFFQNSMLKWNHGNSATLKGVNLLSCGTLRVQRGMKNMHRNSGKWKIDGLTNFRVCISKVCDKSGEKRWCDGRNDWGADGFHSIIKKIQWWGGKKAWWRFVKKPLVYLRASSKSRMSGIPNIFYHHPLKVYA